MVFRTERDRQAYEAWAAQDRLEQAAIAERLERPIREAQLKRELEKNAGRLVAHQRRQTLYGHVERPYIPDDLPQLNTPEEIEDFNRREAAAFFQEFENKGWHPSKNNVETLLGYFTNRSITLIDRRMYRAAFLSLKKDGVFEEPAPAPVPVAAPVQEEDLDPLPRLPLGHLQPIAYRVENTQESYIGLDPSTGRERTFSNWEVEQLSSEDFRKIFRVKTPALTRVNFMQR